MRSILSVLSLAVAFGVSASVADAQSSGFPDIHEGEIFIAAPLTGAAEVPPVETDAIGAAFFRLDADETELSFRLLVGRIDDVTMAHIHVGGPDENGPVAAFLFGFVEATPTINGLVLKGVITDDDVREAGMVDGTLASLAEQMRMGNTYVNVHTVANPAGEIRAQIQSIPFAPPTITATSADLDDSGVVDFGDLTAVLERWGQPAGSGDLLGVLEEFGRVIE